MHKAIALPYSEYQNQPSVPHKQLVEVPDYAAEQKVVFQELFDKFFFFEDDDSELEISYGTEYGFGDINLHKNGCYVYLTYVDEE